MIRDLAGAPNFWPEEQVRHNVLEKYKQDQINGTAFDSESIMLYAFPGTWTKSGTTTAATTATGSWFNQLSFAGPSPIARTYTRKSTAYFGKYGLNSRQ